MFQRLRNPGGGGGAKGKASNMGRVPVRRKGQTKSPEGGDWAQTNTAWRAYAGPR